LEACLQTLQEQLDSLISCDLDLPEKTLDALDTCLQHGCDGKLEIISNARLKDCRRAGNGSDPHVLKCSTCARTCGSVDVIKTVLHDVFTNSSKSDKSPMTDNSFMSHLRWKPLQLPDNDDEMTAEAYSLDVAALAYEYNLHLPQHMASCFKKSNVCRYCVPHAPPTLYPCETYDRV
jgi:hypothetical protein